MCSRSVTLYKTKYVADTVCSTSLQRINSCLPQIFDVSELASIVKKKRYTIKRVQELIGLTTSDPLTTDKNLLKYEQYFPALYDRNSDGQIDEGTFLESKILFRVTQCPYLCQSRFSNLLL